MKILWVKADFLHPTTKGGQIRSLETLRRLHHSHEVHYVAFADPEDPEGVRRSAEYCARAHPVPLRVPPRTSPRFFVQLAAGAVSPVPVAISRYRSREMERVISSLLARERFDRLVCDFLAPAANIRDLRRFFLFQHNVETSIWRRHHEHASGLRKRYFALQARRMFEYERRACRAAGHVIAVSEPDAAQMRELFGVADISAVPTGVDIDYFAPPPHAAPKADLVFVGSMDWLPNIDGVQWFVREILPLIRRRRPDCTVAVVGRKPAPQIQALAAADPRIEVTGTVPDVRPYLWGSAVSIVPLRIGGGTRLKIYESMAARTAVVSTTVGAEGLAVSPPHNIRIADTPEGFAGRCLELLEDPAGRMRVACAALETVTRNFSWDRIAARFEQILRDRPIG